MPEPYEAVTEALGREIEALKERNNRLSARIDRAASAIQELAEIVHRANGHWAPRQFCALGICEEARSLAKETP